MVTPMVEGPMSRSCSCVLPQCTLPHATRLTTCPAMSSVAAARHRNLGGSHAARRCAAPAASEDRSSRSCCSAPLAAALSVEALLLGLAADARAEPRLRRRAPGARRRTTHDGTPWHTGTRSALQK